MIFKNLRFNFSLLVILSLIILLYSYFLTTNKGSKKVEKNLKISNQLNNLNLEKGITKFTDVEYRTTNDKNKSYITKGKEAFLNKKQPNLILLKSVNSFTRLNDGSKLTVKSNNAKYFKHTKNIEYYEKVIITNKEMIVTSELAKFISNKNKIRLEKNVVFKDTNNTIKGDIAELNTLTNDLKIFMIKKKDKVYGQRKQRN